MEKGKTFFIDNNNVCIRLKLYGEDIRKLLIKNSWKETKAEEANYLLVNTCSFLKKAEDKAINGISHYLSNKKAKQKLFAIGCLPSVNPARLSDMPDCEILEGRELKTVIKKLNLKPYPLSISHKVTRKLRPMGKFASFLNKYFIKDDYLTYLCNKEKVFHLKIAEGCLGKCSFCSEKAARGKLKSRRVREIVEELKEGLSQGYKLFSLNADDTGLFGIDNRENIVLLLKEITSINQDFKLVITEMNPFGLLKHSKELIHLLSSPKIVFVTVPIQSGSKKVLKAMKRNYSPSKVIQILQKIREKNQKVMFNTHIIVGFPGETEKDFKKTALMLKKFHFNKVKVFEYSKRPNTIAALIPNQVCDSIKRQRHNELKKEILLEQIKGLNIKEALMGASFNF